MPLPDHPRPGDLVTVPPPPGEDPADWRAVVIAFEDGTLGYVYVTRRPVAHDNANPGQLWVPVCRWPESKED